MKPSEHLPQRASSEQGYRPGCTSVQVQVVGVGWLLLASTEAAGGASVEVVGAGTSRDTEAAEGLYVAVEGVAPEVVVMALERAQGQRLQVCWQYGFIQPSPHLPQDACWEQEYAGGCTSPQLVCTHVLLSLLPRSALLGAAAVVGVPTMGLAPVAGAETTPQGLVWVKKPSSAVVPAGSLMYI